MGRLTNKRIRRNRAPEIVPADSGTYIPQRGRPTSIDWHTVGKQWGLMPINELADLVGCSAKYLQVEGSRRFTIPPEPAKVEMRCEGCLGRYRTGYVDPTPCPHCTTPHTRAQPTRKEQQQ